MDSLTHLVAGALTPLAFKNAPKTRALTVFGIVCGQFPDIDVLAGNNPEAFLSIHRGYTHALVLQPLFALGLALLFHRLLKKGDEDGVWTFGKTWSVALLALVIHIFLDCMTTFGTQIFLPFSDLRVALPAMYIVDLLLTLPLLAVWFIVLRRGGSRAPERLRAIPARSALAWLVCYPLAALALNHTLAARLEAVYAVPGNPLGITRVELSPEPFSPLNWKVVGIAPDKYHMASLFLLRPGREPVFTAHNRVTPSLWAKLQREEPLFSIYAKFATYPLQTVSGESGGTATYTFRDMRYDTTLPELMAAVGRTDGLFLMQAKVTAAGELAAYRFLKRGREGAVTPWRIWHGSGVRSERTPDSAVPTGRHDGGHGGRDAG